MKKVNKKLSIIICSCDAYSDLWLPIYNLHKKFWNIKKFDCFILTKKKFLQSY